MSELSEKVAFVLVSQSQKLAEGLREIVSQMAPTVFVGAAGGTDTGEIGTSFDVVSHQIDAALEAGGSAGVVVLGDTDSARTTIDSVLEFADEASSVCYVNAPLVEGAIAGAMVAERGENIAQVVSRIHQVARQWSENWEIRTQVSSDLICTRTVTVVDADGWHARPTTRLARLVADIRSQFAVQNLTVNGVDGSSVMELMGLGIVQGDTVSVAARGENAKKAVEKIVQAIAAGLDE